MISAGWIGLETAAAARTSGVEVTILEAAELPLLRVLGRKVAQVFADLHRYQGVDLRSGVQVTEITGSGGRADGVRLADGIGSVGNPLRFCVLIDGQPPGAAHGIDVDDQGEGTVTEPRLYQLIRQPKPIADRQFEIEFLDSGVETYAFTFG